MHASPVLRFTSVFCLALLAVFASAQEKVLLAVKGKEGSVGRYTSETSINLDFGGEKATIVSKETSKVTVMKVAADGSVTFEHKTESSEQTVNGEKMPADDKGAADTETEIVRPDGTLVSLKEGQPDEDSEHLGIRIWMAQSPVFSPKPVGVGDKWAHSYKPDSTLGTRSADGTFTLLAFEEVSGAKCVKIQMDYHENGGSPALTSKIVMWVEIVSGDVVKSEHQFDNVPFPGPSGNVVASAKGSALRTAGGPLPESGPPAPVEPEAKKIDDVTKGCEKLEGALTLYRKRESGRQTIYMEIKQSQMDKLLMLQATASTGNAKQLVSGSPIGDIVFRFEELQPDKVTIVVPNFAVRADEGSEADRAVKRSFAESFIEQFNVEGRSKERQSLLIDVSDLFRGDIARISNAFQSGGPFAALSGPSYSLDRDKTFVSAIKAFPENVVFETVYNMVGSGAPTIEDLVGSGAGKGDPRSVAVKVVYNVFELKNKSSYVPRLFDSRVGYFTVWFQDFSRVMDRDQQVQYITRWDLKKKNPDEAVSVPVKPIVFWLDNAIPEKYRDAVRTGILAWNPAFEKIGIKDAIVVNQMPNDADWDPSDMRYNTVRWVTSAGDAYAISQHRENPITGEIMNGNILVDENLVRTLVSERESIVDPASFGKRRVFNPRECRYVQEGLNQVQLGLIASTVLGADNKISADEYVTQFLHNTVTHEFGHMLGLRHNFAASTELSLAQLKDRSKVDSDQPSASVMDYVPFNLSAIGQSGVKYYGQGIGVYDFWAIQYGYADLGKSSPESELYELKKVASLCNLPGHAYESDESTDGFDPYVTKFDLSSNPLEYWAQTVDLSKVLVKSLGTRKPAYGESYFTFTRELQLLVSSQAMGTFQMTRFIGGLRMNGNYRGDGGERPSLAPLPVAVQTRALDLVCKNALSADSFFIPKSYLTKLTENPNANAVESTLSEPTPYPMLDMIVAYQSSMMGLLLAPDRLSLVMNNEFKATSPSTALQLETLFTKVQSAVWSELQTGAAIGPVRRELQRRHMEILVRLLNRTSSAPADARMWAWQGLKGLKSEIASARLKATDHATQVHLDLCGLRIERALNAVETIGSNNGSGTLGLTLN